MGGKKLMTGNMKMGKWFIGDPCYILADKYYDEIWGDKLKYEEGAYRFSPSSHMVDFIVGGTAYGDGCYRGSSGFKYGVDSGTLSVVHEALWDREKIARHKDFKEWGRILNVTHGIASFQGGVFEVTTNEGKEVINTKDEEDEDDYEYGFDMADAEEE